MELRVGKYWMFLIWYIDRFYWCLIELEEFIAIVEGGGLRIEAVKVGELDLVISLGCMVVWMLGAAAWYEVEYKVEC